MNSPKLHAHLFICTKCTFTKENSEESLPEEAAALRSELKNKTRELYGKENVRVTAAGCLGTCDFGISTVMYPHNEWKLGIRPGDETNLLQWIDSKMPPELQKNPK